MSILKFTLWKNNTFIQLTSKVLHTIILLFLIPEYIYIAPTSEDLSIIVHDSLEYIDGQSDLVNYGRKIVEHIILLRAKPNISDAEEKDMLDYLYTSQYQMRGILAVSLGEKFIYMYLLMKNSPK